MLEWRLARADVVNYSGDLMTPPDAAAGGSGKRTTVLSKPKNKTIRGKDQDESSDEGDW
jgi:hypothetical protein